MALVRHPVGIEQDMRITNQQHKIIKQELIDQFGGNATVWLFGSRIDDDKKGGDIDLYIETQQTIDNRASSAAQFSARLQRKLGDQKIDVLLADPQTPRLPIHEAAMQEGIRL